MNPGDRVRVTRGDYAGWHGVVEPSGDPRPVRVALGLNGGSLRFPADWLEPEVTEAAVNVLTADEVRAVVMASLTEVVECFMGPTYWHDNPSAHPRVLAIATRVAEKLAGAAVVLSPMAAVHAVVGAAAMETYPDLTNEACMRVADRAVAKLSGAAVGLSAEERDRCQFCRGTKGGTPGNENNFSGVVACDYCTSLLLDARKAFARRLVEHGELRAVVVEERDRAVVRKIRHFVISCSTDAETAEWIQVIDRLLVTGQSAAQPTARLDAETMVDEKDGAP